MPTYLDAIVAWHRERARVDRRDLTSLADEARLGDAPRDFESALRADKLSVIAEVKRRSPSKGDLAPGLDPAALALQYQGGGAAAMSVLTDAVHFGGSPADLRAARAACGLPVIRKDFTVDARDVFDARIMGADCVLLIAAVLDDGELAELHALARELGMAALVEAHDEAEVERALKVGATLVGVNQRDLVTFEVDHDRAVRVAACIPTEVVSVAESGIRGPADASALAQAGYDAVLVGESLVTSSDPKAAVRALVSAGG